jgi:hypothetical protein
VFGRFLCRALRRSAPGIERLCEPHIPCCSKFTPSGRPHISFAHAEVRPAVSADFEKLGEKERIIPCLKKMKERGLIRSLLLTPLLFCFAFSSRTLMADSRAATTRQNENHRDLLGRTDIGGRAPGHGWEFVCETDTQAMFCQPKMILRLSNGRITCWMKQVQKPASNEEHADGGLPYSLFLHEYDCSERTVRLRSYRDYDSDGKTIRFADMPGPDKAPPATTVTPGSPGEAMLDYACNHQPAPK